MWLLGRLVPDHKTIAEFRRLHREAVTGAGAELIRCARSVGLVRGEWVAIDGSKFRAVSSSRSVREREVLERYLEEMEAADTQDDVVIDAGAVAEAWEKLRQHPQPEARCMRTTSGQAPAYNVQTAVDAEHALIVAQQVTDEANDTRCLQPMAEAAQAAVAEPGRALNVVADAGYSNGEQAEACEAKGIVPHVPANRAVNNQGGWHVVRPQGVYLPVRHGHLPVPGGTDAHPQTAIAERSCRTLCRCDGGLRSLCAEVALYQFFPPLDHASPARRGTESHARTGHAGGYAAAAIDGGTPVRHPEVPHLRTSTLPVTRPQRSANRDELGGARL